MTWAPKPEAMLGRVLGAAEDASPVEAVEAVTRELAAALGAVAVAFLIADLSGRSLVRLTHVAAGPAAELPVAGALVGSARVGSDPDGSDLAGELRRDDEESAVVLPLDGGPAEQALRTQTVRVVPAATSGTGVDGTAPAPLWTVHAPVTERGEAIGLLEMTLPAEPDLATLDQIRRTAHALAFVVIAARRHTDLFEWGQRSTPFTLPAEIQRRLLPAAMTCEAGSVTLSGWLEPAAHIGGDSFDYSLARDTLHLSVTDAMGHGVASALTATLCVGSLRNTRRQGASLLEQVSAANDAILEHAKEIETGPYVTGLLGRLDLRSGVLTVVNAGHVAPFLARGNLVTRVKLAANVPLGLFGETRYRSAELRLEPGDRLVIVTDGMLERNAESVDLFRSISATRALHPREATRALADQVLEAAANELADDATLLVLDWHGGHDDGGRTTVAGADSERASAPLR